MKGSHRIKVYSKKMVYDFVVNRKVTVITGDSGTGKSTLINLISQSNSDSGVTLECDVKCSIFAFGSTGWESTIDYDNQIIFIDEQFIGMNSNELTKVIQKSNCYFVLVTRVIPKFLTYSYKEIYKVVTSGKFHKVTPMYTDIEKRVAPDLVITEDSNSGYKFFNSFFSKYSIPCISARGKDNIENTLQKCIGKYKNILVIADGAAFGARSRILLNEYEYKNVTFFLPESFEFMILDSPMFYDKVKDILDNLPEHIDTSYVSWETYFTKLLEKITQGTPVQYAKNSLKGCYIKNCCYRDKDKTCDFNIIGDKQRIILGKYCSLLDLPVLTEDIDNSQY